MLKPEAVRDMTPEARTALFESLAVKWWGTSYGNKAADDLGVTRSTIFRWRRENTVPFPVLYALDAWILSAAKLTPVVDDGVDVADALNRAAQNLASAGKVLAEMAKKASQPQKVVGLRNMVASSSEPQP